MVIISTQYSTTSFFRSTNGVTQQNTSRNAIVGGTTVADKVKGSWITLPDGSKFRSPTAYYRHSKKLQFGARQHTESRYNNDYTVVESSPGGYLPDNAVWRNSIISGGIGATTSLGSTANVWIPTLMRNEANTKCLNNLADNKANLGENLATLKQLTGMIRSPLETLVSSLKACANDASLRKYIYKSARALAREGIDNVAARKYLEYVYGWKPLVSDIYGIIALMKDEGKKSLLLSSHGSSKQQGNPKIQSYTDISGKSKTDFTSSNEDVLVRTNVWSRLDPNWTGARSLNQLGLLNPLSLAWELVPWSFVVDWVVPIGPVLQALTAPAGLIFVSGTCSARSNLMAEYEHHYTYDDPYQITSSFATGTVEFKGYRRETYWNWPLPGFYVDYTPFGDSDRWMKALALSIIGLRRLK